MAPRTLKETHARMKSSEFVESAIAVHGVGVAATLAEKLGEELREGEEMPDVSFFLELLARRMGRVRNNLVDAADAHFRELANDDEFRIMRDQAMAECTQAYIAARQTVTSSYGVKAVAAFGFESNVATEPAAMVLQIQRLLASFAEPEAQTAEPIYPAIRFDPGQGEATFRPLLDKLQTARAALNQEHRKSDATLLAKDDTVAANDVEFTQISRCFEATFTLAGRPDLARRVRPSTRRPGRRQEVEDEAGDETPLPPVDPTDGTGSDPPTPADEADDNEEGPKTEGSELI